MIRKSVTFLFIIALVTSCATTDSTGTSNSDPNRKTKRGAVIGAVAGAVLGGVVGNQSGNNRTGAVVGAAAGAAIGAAAGRRMDQQEKELRQIEGVDVTRPNEGEIAVALREAILFDYNSSTLRSASRTTLQALAENLRRYPQTHINVEGHTDASGTEAYNQRLSEQRASAVADYLIDQSVPAASITVFGFGELRPVSTNSTADGRQTNRRVEVRIRSTE